MSIIYYPGYSQQVVTPNLRVKTILSVTQAFPCVVTTTEDHGYVLGMNVKFLIPSQFGMVQLNDVTTQVIDLTDASVTLNLDSTNFSSFSYPSPLPSAYTPPSIIPYSSGPYLPPTPLPFGNQKSFEGVKYNDGVP